MANLTDLFGGAGDGAVNYDVLPTYATWDYHSASSASYNVYDGFDGMLTGWGAGLSELFSYEGGNIYTDANPTTNSYTTYGGGFTCLQQAEGHYVINPAGHGNFRAIGGRRSSRVDDIWPFFGVTVNPYGIRQKNSLYVSNTTARKHMRGHYQYSETFSWTSFANTSGTPGNTSYGMVGYNHRTKTLVVLTTGGSSTYRAHVWVNPASGLDGTDFESASLEKFMSNAYSGVNGASYYYNDFTWSTTSSTSYNESNYHLRVIVGDNNKVSLVRFTPNSEVINGYFTLNPSSTSTSVTNGTSLPVTTTYGIDNGNYYGLRHQITWDNKWVAAYAPYYYYGCGIKVHVINTEDPTIYYTYQYDDTSNGVGISPVQEGKFILSYHSANMDSGNGHYVGTMDPQNFRDGEYGSIGAALTVAYDEGGHDSYYSSTNYGWLIPMSSWSGGVRKT